MASIKNSRDNNLPLGPYKDGDDITLANGSRWVWQSGDWRIAAFSANAAVQNLLTTKSAQGVIKKVKAGDVALPPQPGYLRVDTLTADMPTITTTGAVNNATPSISNPVTIANNHAALRFFGARSMVTYSAYVGNGSSAVGSLSAGNGLGYFMEFELDASAFELRLNGDFGTASSLDYMMWIDGMPVSREPLKYGTSTGKWITKFAWATKRRRRITILTAALLHQMWVGPNDVLFPSLRKLNRVAAVVSDSFSVGVCGAGAQSRIGAWMYRTLLRLGFDDIHCAGQSTTGYVNDNSGTNGAGKFRDRLATEVIPVAPDAVFYLGSVNDDNGTITPAQVGVEALANYQQLAAALPNTDLIVVGPQYMDGGVHLPRNVIEAAIVAACAASPNVVRYVGAQGWITGTGKVGTTTGTGNADIYTAADGVHPSMYDGHMYYGDCVYSAVSDIAGLAQ